MTVYADVQNDLVPRFPRELTASELTRAETLVEDASFWLGVWVPGLAEAVAGGNADAANAARLLVVAMVKRELTDPFVAPETVGVESETTGPFSRTFRGFEGQRYAYDQELAELVNLILINRAAAVSMRSRGL